jgi:hypothetical protein
MCTCVGTNNENQLRYYTTYNSGDLLCVLEKEQEEVINKTPTTVEIDLIEREQEDAINKNVSANSTTDNGLNSLGNCIDLFLFSFY